MFAVEGTTLVAGVLRALQGGVSPRGASGAGRLGSLERMGPKFHSGRALKGSVMDSEEEPLAPYKERCPATALSPEAPEVAALPE